ncbi:MAG: (d)CMP kinase [Oscillospiraceae bacterium]|nr:(d)CMP kinase [Oscillospiraceae bacterium]
MNRNIAIDGPAGAGKSTIAKRLAAQLGYVYVDTGAIYRTVGLYALRNGVDKADTAGLTALLTEIQVDLRYGPQGQQMLLNGEDVTDAIRTPEVAAYASSVAAIPAVRAFLLDKQRELARRQNVIMDGRDIGTVVLPDAAVKIFLTASPQVRAKRRWLELTEKGSRESYETVLAEVEARDAADRSRPIAPLRQAEDAILADTSDLNFEESVALLTRIIREKFAELGCEQP